MIVVNETSPRWLRELDRFARIKNLLFVWGNVHDFVSFPVSSGPGGEIRWTDSDLPGVVRRYLLDLEYEVVAWVDPVEELTFAAPEMEAVFRRVERGQAIKEGPNGGVQGESNQETAGPTPPAQPTVAKRSMETAKDLLHLRKPTVTDWHATIDRIARGVQNVNVPCAFIINLASRIVSSPDRPQKDEALAMTRLFKASLFSREVVRGDKRWNNLIVLFCEKMNDLPAFLYVNNPRSRTIQVELPDRDDRNRFIRRYFPYFYGHHGTETPLQEGVAEEFVDMTECLTNYEMRSLLNMSIKERIPLVDSHTGIANVKRLSEMYKYGVTTNDWDKIHSTRLSAAEEFIRKRIKGQDAAIARVLDIVKRAKVGLSAGDSGKSNRPRGVLFFAGPTGVGKTEMAKALASLLFGQEDRLLRFDMSEYAAPQSDQRLLGAPPGYVGYEEGGQLTNAVKKNPFSILLFDEIEKAHGSIFDKFLQILDDGRLTDGKGETIYFSECIIVFTSNLGTVARSQTSEAGASVLVTPDMPYARMREIVQQEIRDHFNFVLGRPEILNRLGDNFVVFDFIKPPLDGEIVDLLIAKLARFAKESKKMHLLVDAGVRDTLVGLARGQLHHGGRGIRNVVDNAFVNPLSRALFDANVQPHTRVRVVELLDAGADATTRFQLKIALDTL